MRVTKKDMMEETSKDIKIIRNLYGVRIKKACISCNNKNIDALGRRVCIVSEKLVHKYDVCDKWVLSCSLDRAGANV